MLITQRTTEFVYYRVKRPKKLLQPFELVSHDCSFAARSLASVSPIVRLVRGFAEPGSGVLILASVCSFLRGVAIVSRLAREPNSLFMSFVNIDVPGSWLSGGLTSRPRAPGRKKGVASSAEIASHRGRPEVRAGGKVPHVIHLKDLR